MSSLKEVETTLYCIYRLWNGGGELQMLDGRSGKVPLSLPVSPAGSKQNWIK
jgi:hypothetical protein